MFDLLVDALAVFRLAVFVSDDAFPPMMWIREKVMSRWPSEDTQFLVDAVKVRGEEAVSIDHEIPLVQDHQENWVAKDIPHWVAIYPSRWSKLLTCVRCQSIWWAAVAYFGRTELPSVWVPSATILALSAIAFLVNLLRTY